MSERIGIRVYGLPIPQGSKTPVMQGGRPRMKDANEKRLKPWRRDVRDQASQLLTWHDTFTGPVRIWLRFTFTRPPSHYRTGRNAHLIKDTSPAMPTGHDLGDLDKLQRAIFDALTDAKIWVDDALVVDVRARKMYAGEDEYALDQAGVDIIIEPLDLDVPLDGAPHTSVPVSSELLGEVSGDEAGAANHQAAAR